MTSFVSSISIQSQGKLRRFIIWHCLGFAITIVPARNLAGPKVCKKMFSIYSIV